MGGLVLGGRIGWLLSARPHTGVTLDDAETRLCQTLIPVTDSPELTPRPTPLTGALLQGQLVVLGQGTDPCTHGQLNV